MAENERFVPVAVYCDLIERELNKALEDVVSIRANETRKLKVKSSCLLLRAALGNARHYLKELEQSLE